MVTIVATVLTLLIAIWEIDLNWLEWPLLFCVLVVAWLRPDLGKKQFQRIEAQLHKLARRRALSVAAIAILTVVLRLALLLSVPAPQPRIVDEFSHLLLADTLSHGRLTNPTHPLWTHFETIHEIQRPTYNSMYFPLQGAFLATGEVAGNPWFGEGLAQDRSTVSSFV